LAPVSARRDNADRTYRLAGLELVTYSLFKDDGALSDSLNARNPVSYWRSFFAAVADCGLGLVRCARATFSRMPFHGRAWRTWVERLYAVCGIVCRAQGAQKLGHPA
jgi:hypothetical protein